MVRDWLQRIRDRVTADDESESAGDGYLSTRAEWHAAAWGFTALFLATFFGRWELAGLVVAFLITGQRSRGELNVPYPRQIVKESLYALAHGAAGAVLGTLSNAVLFGDLLILLLP